MVQGLPFKDYIPTVLWLLKACLKFCNGSLPLDLNPSLSSFCISFGGKYLAEAQVFTLQQLQRALSMQYLADERLTAQCWVLCSTLSSGNTDLPSQAFAAYKTTKQSSLFFSASFSGNT